MKVAALDLSLTSTGIARMDDLSLTTDVFKPKTTGHERLDAIITTCLRAALGADLVLVEGPAFGAKGDAYHQLAGLWWLVTHEFHRSGRPFAVVTPAALKLYATGSGNASKDRVVIEVARRWPNVALADNNAADALVMAAMGSRHLGHPVDELPKTHLAAMTKVRWPDHEGATP